MYYRQKVLLRILDEFDKSLSNTDCQKIVFLFCQKANKNYYDFFPYRYGGFSHVLYNDKRQLIREKMLRDEDEFSVNSNLPKFKLSLGDEEILQKIKTEIGNIRGKQLIRKVYKEYPFYATKSEILEDVLSSEEIRQLEITQSVEETACLFTLGYEGISIDAFLSRLLRLNIKMLIDVRNNPLSRKFGFSKTKLNHYVDSVGINYLHLPKLGIPSSNRKNLDDEGKRKKLLQYYRSQILPSQLGDLEEIISLMESNNRIALLCFEANHKTCHRNEITEFLLEKKHLSIPILHL